MNATQVNDNQYTLVDGQGRQWSITRVIDADGVFFNIDPDAPVDEQLRWGEGGGRVVWVARLWAADQRHLVTAMFDEADQYRRYRGYDTAQEALDAVRATHGGAS
jgi:hypothetical protein